MNYNISWKKINLHRDNVFFFLLLLFAATLPFSRDIAGGMMVLALPVWLIKSFRLETRWEKSFITFGILLMTILFTVSYLFGLGRFEHDTMAGRIIPSLLWFFIISTVPLDKKRIDILLSVFLCAMTAGIFYHLLFHFSIPYSHNNRLVLYGHCNPYGQLAAMSCLLITGLLLFGKNHNKLNLAVKLFSFLVLVSGLFFTYSRGAWVGFAAGFLWLTGIAVARKKQKILPVVLIFLLCFGLFTTNPDFSKRLQSIFSLSTGTNIQRIVIWQTALDMAAVSPVTGMGLNMFRYHFSEMNRDSSIIRSNQPHAHNNFLQLLAELGMVGVTVFIIMLAAVFLRVTKIMRESKDFWTWKLSCITGALLISWFTHGLVDFSLWYRPATMLFLTVLGLLISIDSFKGQNAIFPIKPPDEHA